MIAPVGPLPEDLETAHQLIRELLETLGQQIHFNAKLQHQLEQLLRHRYGRKSERIDPAQLLLFAREILAQAGPEPEPEPDPASEPTSHPSTPRRKTNGHGRKPLPASLPRKPVVHDIPPERLPCPDCGAPQQCIGSEVREQLEYVPASLFVIEHIRPKYACPDRAAHVGDPIASGQKTTNFQQTVVQKALSQTMVIENPQDLRANPRDFAGS